MGRARSRALRAPNTERGYRYDWRAFASFCAAQGFPALPACAESVSLYIADCLKRGLKVSTVRRRVAAVVYRHRAIQLASPVDADIRDLLRGARRLLVQETRQVRPLSVGDVRAIAELLLTDDSLLSTRNRAIVVVGFCSALRTANLATLTLAQVEFTDRGALLRIGREKQDQEAKGRLIGLPTGRHPTTCPVRALQDWIERRGNFAGPLFTRRGRRRQDRPLEPERLGQIVQQCVERIGLDSSLYGGHSLRAGFVTAAGEQGVGELLIAAQTGHKDMSTLRRYFRRTDVFRANACRELDL